MLPITKTKGQISKMDACCSFEEGGIIPDLNIFDLQILLYAYYHKKESSKKQNRRLLQF